MDNDSSIEDTKDEFVHEEDKITEHVMSCGCVYLHDFWQMQGFALCSLHGEKWLAGTYSIPYVQ